MTQRVECPQRAAQLGAVSVNHRFHGLIAALTFRLSENQLGLRRLFSVDSVVPVDAISTHQHPSFSI
jgi:hypothetical protein